MIIVIVMMAVSTVYMAMLDFFSAGIANIDDIYVIKQRSAG